MKITPLKTVRFGDRDYISSPTGWDYAITQDPSAQAVADMNRRLKDQAHLKAIGPNLSGSESWLAALGRKISARVDLMLAPGRARQLVQLQQQANQTAKIKR